MAKVIDADESGKQNLEAVTEALKEPVTTETDQTAEKVSSDSAWDNKSPEELKAILNEQKNMIGRQSNDVGAARKEAERLKVELEAIKKADAMMQGHLNRAQSQEPAKKPDYYGDPESAVKSQISSDPGINDMRKELDTLKVDSIKRDLSSSHPDYAEVLASGDFEQWVSESPMRRNSYSAMNRDYDIDIAKELIAEYKAARSDTTQKKPDRAETVRAASSGNVTGSTEPSSGKKIRAADLRALQINNPSRYQELMPEIMRAYQEGRVIN